MSIHFINVVFRSTNRDIKGSLATTRGKAIHEEKQEGDSRNFIFEVLLVGKDFGEESSVPIRTCPLKFQGFLVPCVRFPNNNIRGNTQKKNDKKKNP